jgi:hypothetical protein
MLGVLDQLYVRARAALLDSAEALSAHLDAVVLVGAQAVYMHTGDADLAIAEYTTDADFAISPTELAAAPLLEGVLTKAGFTAREHPGGWLSPQGVYVDLMVPEALAGPGTRGARLGEHGKRVHSSTGTGVRYMHSTQAIPGECRCGWPDPALSSSPRFTRSQSGLGPTIE